MEKGDQRRNMGNWLQLVGGRWLDVDKGDVDRPEYRSRFVAKEINTGPEEGLFASTPPLEALRWLLSEASTVEYEGSGLRGAGGPDGAAGSSAGGDRGCGQRRAGGAYGAAGSSAANRWNDMGENVMLVSDVSRAFFEAPATRAIAVTLPTEALEEHEYGMGKVGILQMSLYGTRDAAVNFQREVTKLMTKLGFAQAKYNASLFYHARTKVAVMVHGDDFVATGKRHHVQEFRKAIADRFTVKDKLIGSSKEAG